MGTIRPKPGTKVQFNSWLCINNTPTPPQPWTGDVIGPAYYLSKQYYHVKRDADGEVVALAGNEMYYRKGEGTL